MEIVDKLTNDERRRLEALGMALNYHARFGPPQMPVGMPGATAPEVKTITETAYTFEQYIFTGEAAREKPEAGYA